jgi:hypothetical protein
MYVFILLHTPAGRLFFPHSHPFMSRAEMASHRISLPGSSKHGTPKAAANIAGFQQIACADRAYPEPYCQERI